MMMAKSFYKDIPNHPNYIITRAGDVISKKKLKVIKPDISNGYRRIQLDGKKYYIAYLVAEAFIPKRSSFTNKVIHLDRNSMNDRCCNLRWVYPKELHRKCHKSG